jgi:hypothetical protein
MWAQWEALLSRLKAPQHRYSLLLAVLWPLVVLIIAVLALRRVSTAKDLADLISATASLLWPIIMFAIVSWFRPEIRTLLARIRKGKFLGQEIELLEEKTDAAVANESVVVSATGAADGSSSVTGVATALGEVEEVLREASRSPRMGLMLLSARIERAARDLVLDTGLNVTNRQVPLSVLIRHLVQTEQITSDDAEALMIFNRVRNQIVHGHDASDDEIARAIDSGTRLLRLLLSRPRPPQSKTEPD